MVEKNGFLYLLVGHDQMAKDLKLKKIREDFLVQDTAAFDQDLLHARDLTLKLFQERCLLFPVKAKRRLIIIRDASALKDEVKEFILKEIKTLNSRVVLVLDLERLEGKDDFFRQAAKFSQVFSFGFAAPRTDTFTLNRQIELKRADMALRVLGQLLKNGEKPERIMGGLRYVWEKDITRPQELKKRLKLLLNCDLEIKRGKLKPDFALEKLVVGLCAFLKS